MEWNIHHHKYIREPLNSDTDGAVAQIACPRFRGRIIININDLIQIIDDEGGDAFKFGKVEEGSSPNDAFRCCAGFCPRYDGGARDYGGPGGDGVVGSDGGDSVGAGGDGEGDSVGAGGDGEPGASGERDHEPI